MSCCDYPRIISTQVTAAEERGLLGTYISDRTVEFSEARELIMSGKSAIIAGENQMYQTSRTFHDHSDPEYCSWVSDLYVPGAAATAGMLFRREDPIRDIFRLKYVIQLHNLQLPSLLFAARKPNWKIQLIILLGA